MCRHGDRAVLTTVDAQVLLQVMLVLEGFRTFSALEFPIGPGLSHVTLRNPGDTYAPS